MRQLWIIYFLVLLAPVACKSADGPSSQNPVSVTPEARQSGIIGEWAQECISAQNQSVSTRMTFRADGSCRSSVRLFADGACGSPAYETITEGTFTVGAPVGAGTAIDRVNRSIQEVFFLDAQVAANNQAGYRGYRGWQKGVPYSRPAEVSMQYDIFRIDGNQMLFGKVSQTAGAPNDGLSPQTRPKEISTEMRPLIRKP